MDTVSLQKMSETQMIERVSMARFPQEMTKADVKLLAQVAITYGFDPLMGEVTLYQGRPFVSIDGRYRKAQETGELDGVETKPATKDEREAWGIPAEDYFFRAAVYVAGSTRPFIGWGRVFKAETIGGKGYKPIEKNPQRMAEKRAEAQALRKAFHIPLPSKEDIGSPDYDIDSEAIEVDKNTGEIKETAVEAETIKEPEKQEAPEHNDSDKAFVNLQSAGEPSPIDLDWLKESLEKIGWPDVGKYLKDKYKVSGQRISALIKQLSKEQATEFVAEVQKRLELSL